MAKAARSRVEPRLTRARLLGRTIRYHWLTNLAVLLGVVAGTAVVGGALIVGDSVRGSLRDMVMERLYLIDQVLTGHRFFREALAREMAKVPEIVERLSAGGTAIVLPGSMETPADSAGTVSRAGQVSVYGGDTRMLGLAAIGNRPPPLGEDVLISENLARDLRVQPGDGVLLSVELPSDIPRDSLLGKRDDTSVRIPLTVRDILPESSTLGRFGLRPDQQLPRNVFLNLKTLQDRLGIAEVRDRRDGRVTPARVNSVFVKLRRIDEARTAAAVTAAENLSRNLSLAWKLDDFHLRVVPNSSRSYLSLESERLILERPVAQAAARVAKRLELPASPVLVYIANEISVAERTGDERSPADADPPRYSRYSVVAGLDPQSFTQPNSASFGPYVFNGEPPAGGLGDGTIEQPDGVGEILINDWLAADLAAKAGDVVRLTYHVVGSHGELPEVERRFKVRGILKLDDTIAADRGLTPEVRGITDVESFDQWDSPFPMKPVTSRDDAYWARYRATPKAFVTLDTAQRLWSSRYGDLTSFRVAAPPGKSLEEAQTQFTTELLAELKPDEMGMVFQPVKYQGLHAAAGTTDFAGLFLGFSFFLILSAAILIGLLFRLGIEQRAANVGLLLATGFSNAQVGRLLLAEGLVVVTAGTALGLFAAVGYAWLMIYGLKTWWIGAIGTRFLELHLEPASLGIGAAVSVVVALFAIGLGLRGFRRVSPRSLLAGNVDSSQPVETRRSRRRRAGRLAAALAAFAVTGTAAVVFKAIPDVEAFSGFSWPTIVFFLVGMATLAAGIAFLAARLDADGGIGVRGSGWLGVARLALRNAARNRSRSLLSTGLIASATFLIVAIAAAQRNPAREQPDRNSGNGGFTLVAEAAVPVLYDLNSRDGRDKLGLVDTLLQDDSSKRALAALGQAIGFRVNPGENASCLNIYQTSQPTVLGVPPEMIERGGFKFVGGGTNPWTRLRAADTDGAIPVFGDMNTLQYSLKVGLGQTLELRDEFHQPFKVRIAGMLDGSVFQGVLLMDDEPFRRRFPSRVGAQYFLIEAPLSEVAAVTELLESKLPGFDAERVADRLASFLAVQNTYLSTFQALGGLGLLLGTIGLAIVMLRNVLERRRELALFRAVGFGDSSLQWLVLCENALLLVWGLACGTVSALLAMLPHLLTTGADVSWPYLAGILLVVFATGMTAALAAAGRALRTPVLATLRSE